MLPPYRPRQRGALLHAALMLPAAIIYADFDSAPERCLSLFLLLIQSFQPRAEREMSCFLYAISSLFMPPRRLFSPPPLPPVASPGYALR